MMQRNSDGDGAMDEQRSDVGREREPLRVEYLWWAECPSHAAGYALLEQALDAEGVAATITSIEVTSDEDAQRLAFIGSPTIRLGGADIDPAPVATGAANRYALACRAYRREDGRIAPLPTLAFVRTAIRRARERAAAPE